MPPPLPFFPLYAADWLTSQKVQLLPLKMQSVYLRLLCQAWLKPCCSLPHTEPDLRVLGGLDTPDIHGEDDEDFKKVLRCFEPHPTLQHRLIDPRLYAERLKADARIEALSNAGKKSGRMRQAKLKPCSKPRSKQVRSRFEHLQSESESESEVEKEAERKKQKGRKSAEKPPPPTDQEWVLTLKAQSCYAGLDVDQQLGKCQTWCDTNRRAFSRRRFVNWLNRAEKPMNGVGTGNGHARSAQIPPYPGPEDPISRNLWRKTYGDPKTPRLPPGL